MAAIATSGDAMGLRQLCALLLLLVGADVRAEEIGTAAGVFALPDGFRALSAEGRATASGRLYVFVREADVVPRAIYTMTVEPLPPGAVTDVAVAAAQLADPTMTVPDGRPARRVKIGGIAGRRHSTTMSNRMVVTAYAVDFGGQRMLVQLKYPGSSEYRADAVRFEQALRAFRWVGAEPGDTEAVRFAETTASDGDDAAAAVADVVSGATVAASDAPAIAVAAPAEPAAVSGPASGEATPALGSVWSDVDRIAPGLELADPAAAAPTPQANAATASAPAATSARVPTAETTPTAELGGVWSDVDRIDVEDLAAAFAEPEPEPAAPDPAAAPPAPIPTVETAPVPAPAAVDTAPLIPPPALETAPALPPPAVETAPLDPAPTRPAATPPSPPATDAAGDANAEDLDEDEDEDQTEAAAATAESDD